MPRESRQQTGVTYGNAGLYTALIWLLRHFSIRSVYTFMSVCVIPVAMLVSPGARIAYRYFHKRRGLGWWKSVKATYKNHCLFGQTVIDKFAVYAGHTFKVSYHGLEAYQSMLERPEAFVQLNAHIGCSEMLGYSLHLEKRCNVLVYGGEKQSLMGYRQASFGQMNMRMVPVGTANAQSEAIANALDRGEIVSAFADRYFNSNKVVQSKLHDFTINLARGPFSLAVTRGIDVVMVSAMKEPDGTYSAYFTPLSYDRSQPKSTQRQQLADAYTAEMERLLGRYPLQWFNYFNLWADKA